jgi:hypothetical protein
MPRTPIRDPEQPLSLIISKGTCELTLASDDVQPRLVHRTPCNPRRQVRIRSRHLGRPPDLRLTAHDYSRRRISGSRSVHDVQECDGPVPSSDIRTASLGSRKGCWQEVERAEDSSRARHWSCCTFWDDKRWTRRLSQDTLAMQRCGHPGVVARVPVGRRGGGGKGDSADMCPDCQSIDAIRTRSSFVLKSKVQIATRRRLRTARLSC